MRQWWVTGRVPGPGGRGPWRTVERGPFATAREAADEGRRLRLGGRRVELRPGPGPEAQGQDR